MSKIWHTPEWYRRKGGGEKLPPRIKSMLQNDCGEYWDPTNNDEENIELYQQRFNTPDFMSWHGAELFEIEMLDMKELNKVEYYRITKGYGDTEKHYLKAVDEIAKDLLNCSTERINYYRKAIRKEAQTPLHIKKKEQQIRAFINRPVSTKLNEDESIFTWNDVFGSSKDYRKETNYLSCMTNLMIAVEKRMDMIAKENIKNIKKQNAVLLNRLEKVNEYYNHDFEEGWVSRWLLLPIETMLQFNEEFDEKVKLLSAEEKEQPTTKAELDRLKSVMKEKESPLTRLTGFED